MKYRVYLYILDSIKNVKGTLLHSGCVPWPLWWDKKAYYSNSYSKRLQFQKPGKGRIFFGPCKKAMRWEIRDFMTKAPNSHVYIVGLSNSAFRRRRLVYYMKVDGQPMRFSEAYNRYTELRGTGIHIRPINKVHRYKLMYYGKQRPIELKYKHLGTVSSCKKAIHYDDWIKDIARDYNKTNFRKCGPDCCFMGTKDSVFFGKKNIEIDTTFCRILKKGGIFEGKLEVDSVNIKNPIPNPRGRHVVLDGIPASEMVEKLEEELGKMVSNLLLRR